MGFCARLVMHCDPGGGPTVEDTGESRPGHVRTARSACLEGVAHLPLAARVPDTGKSMDSAVASRRGVHGWAIVRKRVRGRARQHDAEGRDHENLAPPLE